jgi:hypothetical protein
LKQGILGNAIGGISMTMKARMSDSIALPPSRLCIGITGHREGNAAFAANRHKIEMALTSLFDLADTVVLRQKDTVSKTRLLTPLAQGTDLMAAELALARDWDICAPLPFGDDLNIAINLDAAGREDMLAYLAGGDGCEAATLSHAAHMRGVANQTRRFELAEQDALVEKLFVDSVRNPDDPAMVHAFATLTSERAAAASRVMIEQSDILFAVWDGVTLGAMGGTRHTMATALNMGVPVIWIEATLPDRWILLREPEALSALHPDTGPLDKNAIEAVFDAILNPPGSDKNERAIGFHTEQWHPKSRRRFHAYRRIERLFGGDHDGRVFASLQQHYEAPDAIAKGSGAGLLRAAQGLPGGDQAFVTSIEQEVLRRFAWADGLSTYLSDAYRGGMVMNFLLSACAIVAGIAYLPFAGVDFKWPFALLEFLLLIAILAITWTGGRKSWHRRWFQTRRVAEYFRHAPLLLLLGVARASGRWPRGKDSEWPEYYAREVLCDLGLPGVKVTQVYLRSALENLLHLHVNRQRIYHQGKAVRLTKVHHKLDKLSEISFVLAVTSVAAYLVLFACQSTGLVPEGIVHGLSKTFTFFGVAFPALGGAFAGIRYFGDFERFAAISEVAAEKLAEVEKRIDILRLSPQSELNYGEIADLVHAIDDIVVTEIENWQAVFGQKQITVPV